MDVCCEGGANLTANFGVLRHHRTESSGLVVHMLISSPYKDIS